MTRLIPRLALALLVPLLAACAWPQAHAVPDRISLSARVLTVVFTDGTTCRADIVVLPAGRLTDCAYPIHYEVVIERQSHLRALDPLFSPYATVLLRDDRGRRWTWRTPHRRIDR